MGNGDGLAWHCWSLLEICWIGSAVGSGISLMQSRRKRYTSARLHHWQLPLTLYICFQCVFFSAYVSWGGCKSIAKALWCHWCELGGSGWVREQVTCCICRHEEVQKGSGYSFTSCWPWTNFLKQEKKKKAILMSSTNTLLWWHPCWYQHFLPNQYHCWLEDVCIINVLANVLVHLY